jgi:plastocyanin domain-containing protein
MPLTSKTAQVVVLPVLLALACSDARAGSGSAPAPAVATPKDGTVAMQVTEAGFVPSQIKAKKGEPLKLVVTRKTDATCAKQIVIDEHGVNVPLPLDEPVTVAFTPAKSGELKFGCAMDKMIGGVLFIE